MSSIAIALAMNPKRTSLSPLIFPAVRPDTKAPVTMPVILIGALGGLATTGILGMFLGATLLALGYQLFMAWVAGNRDFPPVEREPHIAG